MKRLFIFVLFLFSVNVSAQPVPSYYSRSDFLMAPPGSFNDGLLGFSNPANLQFLKSFESRFIWDTDGTDRFSIHDWGAFAGTRGLGLGVFRQHNYVRTITDYRISTGGGSDSFAFGLAYGWSRGHRRVENDREKLLSAGTIMRPNRFLSLGLVGNFSLQSSAREGVAEIGIRPLGSPLLTLFTDGALYNDERLSETRWSAGGVLQVMQGIQFVGRYFHDKAFTIGLNVEFGHSGIAAQSHFTRDKSLAHNTYMIRSGGMKHSVFTKLAPGNSRVLPVDLKGRVDYLNYVIIDKSTHRFFDLLQNIKSAAKDPRVGVIAVNLSAALLLPEHAWEIREALKDAQKSGKKIITFFDSANMTEYHLASVADVVVMDPQGILMLTGYGASRTFFKGTLEKLGLGFDEWRFFKYKSAYENYRLDHMSEADRKQRQDYVDSQYELVRADISDSRTFSDARFDSLINNGVLFTAEQAIKSGLVDTLGRWTDFDDIVNKMMHQKAVKISPQELLSNALPLQQWGEKPVIALVYGLGECAMDTGIRARWLERVFLKLKDQKNVKAVVFRVDSPGGDVTASDVVAEALKKCAEKKPVIISQGQVAGSGGYWISMYGDEIIAAPNTVTGSIGVIGGWVWDKGFGEKLGMTYDHVQRGAHADIGRGIRLPLLGITVPARNLTAPERKRIEFMIKDFYNSFVKKVAAGRHLSEDKVRKIAQGHFYSGKDGLDIGLVDKLGGLMTALAVAKEKAGLKPKAEFRIVEIPRNKGFINLQIPAFPVKSGIENDPVIRYIKMITQNPGKPLPMMVPGSYPTAEE